MVQGSSTLEHMLTGGGTHCSSGAPLASLPFWRQDGSAPAERGTATVAFKMNSEKHILYREAQPDLDYEFEMAGPGVIERGVENMKIDHGE